MKAFTDTPESRVWFSSDLHVGHTNIMKFCPITRVADSVEDMNNKILAAHQEVVGPNDHLFILGDVFFSKEDYSYEWLSKVPGKKHLIWGNHDQVIQKSEKIQGLFESIDQYLEITVNTIRVVMFHYPIEEWNSMHRGAYHLHGHTHGNLGIKRPFRSKDVGIDCREQADFRPFSWTEINNELKDLPIKTHH